MVNFCCVPCCSNNSIRDSNLSYFRLPLRNKGLLKQWIHSIGRKNLPINANMRVCSQHFYQGGGRQLRPDEVPSLVWVHLDHIKRENHRGIASS